MTVAFLRLALAYSPDEIRGLSESRTREFEVIQIPGRHRWVYVPHSREVDDGVNWLLPSWNTANMPGRWGRWQIASDTGGGGSGPDLSDVDPLALDDVADPGVSAEASRADHVHPNTGLATDAELASEALTRATDDLTLSGAIASEALARSTADALLVPKTRTITTTAPLKIGGSGSADLSADRTLTVDDATTAAKGVVQLATPSADVTAGHVVQANDTRLSDARTPTAHAASHQNGGGDEIATATPGANVIPKAGAGGKLAAGFMSAVLASSDLTNDSALEKTANKGAASGYASLNSGTKVVEDPANATATPTASKIVIADAGGKVDGWVSDADATTKGKIKLAKHLGGSAALPEVIGMTETSGPTSLLFGSVGDGKLLQRSGSTVIGVDSTAAQMAEIMLIKPFFTTHSLMPATTHKEELYAYPATDFANLNSGTKSVSLSRSRFTPSGNPANWGWDMGGLKTKCLFIFNGTRPRSFGLGLFMSDTLPSASEIPDKSWLFNLEAASGVTCALYKKVSGTFTSLATEVKILPADVFTGPTWGMAFYYDDSTDRLICFLRLGPETWIPIMDVTNTSLTTVRYVGIRTSTNAAADVSWTVTPMAIYYTT